MNLIEIIVLAIALGMDCLVVSFSQGLIFNQNNVKNSLLLALTMGLFQGLMPIISYFGTDAISMFVELHSKWLVASIFTVLGIKFIVEALDGKEEEVKDLCLKCIVGLGIATSIDAFGAGINLSLTETPILLSIIIIGVASFVMSMIGFWSSKFLKKLPSKALEVVGGIILIALAVFEFIKPLT